MPQTFNSFDGSLILQPAQAPGDARQDALALAPSTTFKFGDVLAISGSASGSTGKLAVVGGGDAFLNRGIGLMMMSGVTDAAGKFYPGSGINASIDLIQGGWMTAPYWKSGIFDPTELKIGGAAASLANLSTLFGTRYNPLPNGMIQVLGQ